jgi:hypothetical protein
MPSPPPDPPISDVAPSDRYLTGYDQQHLVTYLRLLDADAEGADWQDVAKIVLHIDPERGSGKACVGEPFGACEMDDGERFSPSPVRRRASLNFVCLPSGEQLQEPGHVQVCLT